MFAISENLTQLDKAEDKQCFGILMLLSITMMLCKNISHSQYTTSTNIQIQHLKTPLIKTYNKHLVNQSRQIFNK